MRPGLRGSAAQVDDFHAVDILAAPCGCRREHQHIIAHGDLLTSEFSDLALDRAAELREDRGQGADADVGDSHQATGRFGKVQTTAVAGAVFRLGASSRRTSVVAMRLFSRPFAAGEAATLRTAAAR